MPRKISKLRTTVTCPVCGKSRTVLVSNTLRDNFTGRCRSCANLEQRRLAMEYYAEKRTRILTRTENRRECLRCGTAFPSTGPGNRLCNSCRSHQGDHLTGLEHIEIRIYRNRA